MMFTLRTCAYNLVNNVPTKLSPTLQLSLVPTDINPRSSAPFGSVLIAVARECSLFNRSAWSVKHPWLVNAKTDPDVFIIIPTKGMSVVVDTNKDSGLRTVTVTNNGWVHITYSIPLTKTIIISYTGEFLPERVYNVVPIHVMAPVPALVNPSIHVPVDPSVPAPVDLCVSTRVLPRDDDDSYGDAMEAYTNHALWLKWCSHFLENDVPKILEQLEQKETQDLLEQKMTQDLLEQLEQKLTQDLFEHKEAYELFEQKNVASVNTESGDDDYVFVEIPSEHATVPPTNSFVDEMTGVTVTDPPAQQPGRVGGCIQM